MRHIYSTVFILLLPIIVLRLYWRSIKLPSYRKRIPERFAIFKAEEKTLPQIWIHAASVGEFIAFKPIIDEILSWGSHAVTITTMTPTGSDRVQETYGSKVNHYYIPYDLSFLIKKFLNKVKPVLAIFIETELWPNTIRQCQQHGVITMLANGRLSEKSAAGYQRFAALCKPMISTLSCAAIQFEDDAERFKALGLNPETCLVTGSIKFDISVSKHDQENAKFLHDQIQEMGQRKVFIAASTHKGEEAIVLDAFKTIKAQYPNSLLILAPRHPDRFKVVSQLCEGQNYTITYRSSQQAPTNATDVLFVDTMGELFMLYGCADVAFVGGSLIENGGHNYLEPAAWGIPTISGPSTFNFAMVSKKLIDANAMFIADNAQLISSEVLKLFSNESTAKRKGLAAAKVVIENRGAKPKLIALIKGLLNIQ